MKLAAYLITGVMMLAKAARRRALVRRYGPPSAPRGTRLTSRVWTCARATGHGSETATAWPRPAAGWSWKSKKGHQLACCGAAGTIGADSGRGGPWPIAGKLVQQRIERDHQHLKGRTRSMRGF